MQYPVDAIASAISQFYEAASLHKIARQIKLDYGVSPSHMSIYRWIARYSQKAAKILSKVPIEVGSKWVADETVLNLKGDNVKKKKPERGEGIKAWFWDVVDDDTRFLLASHLSEGRFTRDAKVLMERAANRANKAPDSIITDKLAAYLDGTELAFGADTKHIRAETLTSEPAKQLVERFHGTLKDRTKVLRSFLRKDTAKIITDGWSVHYNFFRPHRGLKGKTPAEAAKAKAPFHSWKDVVTAK